MGLIGLIGLIGCTKEVTPGELASLAAKGYYEELRQGRYDAFVEGIDGVAETPEDYRQQLRKAAEQYVKELEQQHQGISSIEVTSAKADSSLQSMNVFMVLCFGDSTREEICVPMVERSGAYRMR